MVNPEYLEILKKGVEEWNKWREENKVLVADLRNADLRNADLSNADLRYVDLSYADLSYANLSYANLSYAKLIYTNLNKTNLIYAYLSHANFNNAYLSNANLRNAKLENGNFNNASFDSTIFGFTDLANCINLESTKHNGPSLIEGRTVKFNYNNLPIKFLKGCGFNKWQIEAIKLNNPKLTDTQITDIVYEIDRLRNISPIQPYSVFISYSRKDESFVEKIEKKFDVKDVRYWRDIHHATAGPLEKQITSAIHLNPTVLLVLSKESVQSDWVEFESRKARELEKKLNRHVICPVALDNSWKTCSWPERLRQQIEEYNILDFSQWQDDTFFEKQFSKLLKGLNIYYKKG